MVILIKGNVYKLPIFKGSNKSVCIMANNLSSKAFYGNLQIMFFFVRYLQKKMIFIEFVFITRDQRKEDMYQPLPEL